MTLLPDSQAAQIEREAIAERIISSDAIFEEICEMLEGLSDKRLSNLVEIIRKTQMSREDERIVDSVI